MSSSTAKSLGQPVPVIVGGKTEVGGQLVIDSLKPDYEVIHFILSSTIETELPQVLKGETPKDAGSSLGTGNWSQFPKAVLLGGTFEDDLVERLRKLVAETPGAKAIPWLRVDSSIPHPPLGPEYAKIVIDRARARILELEKEGKFDGEDDGIYLF